MIKYKKREGIIRDHSICYTRKSVRVEFCVWYRLQSIRYRSVRVEFFDTVSVFIVALWIHDVVNIDHKPAILARFTGI